VVAQSGFCKSLFCFCNFLHILIHQGIPSNWGASLSNFPMSRHLAKFHLSA
jgi:hypothetical protein